MLQIGKVLKSNGTDGTVIAGLRDIDLEDILTEEPVYITFDGLPVPFFIESAVRRGTGRVLLHLSGVDTLRDAEELVGRELMADYFEEDELSAGAELIGWTVRGAGTVTDFLDIPSNPCVEVTLPDGRSVLLPLHDDLIREADPARREIVMDIPDGLLD